MHQQNTSQKLLYLMFYLLWYKSYAIIVIIFYYLVMHSWTNAAIYLLCPINWEFFNSFCTIVSKILCHSQKARLSNYRSKTQYITMQEFRSLTIFV